MLRTAPSAIACVALFCAASASAAPDFDAGSDGSFGALLVPASTSLEVALPDDGVIHATEVVVEADAFLTFAANPNNTPVYLLSQGDILIAGTLEVAGHPPPGSIGGPGGPGGFQGGRASAYQPLARPYDVGVDPQLLHLLGGRGGDGNGVGPTPGCGGGGGGGAILLASNTRIELSGTLDASGGPGTCSQAPQRPGDPGAPGHVRFVAPAVVGAGTLALSGTPNTTYGRVDALYSEANSWTVTGATFFSLSEGHTLVGRLSTVPQARIVSVGGQAVAQAAGPVSVTFPPGASRTQDVVIEVSGFSATGSVEVRLERQTSGGPASTLYTDTATLDLATGTTVTIPAEFEPLMGTWLDVVVR